MTLNFNKLLVLFLTFGITLLISCHSARNIEKLNNDEKSQNIRLIYATSDIVSLRSGSNYWENAWTISPDINPHKWYVMPEENQSIKASFITNIDSLTLDIKEGDAYNFVVILNNMDTAVTQIKGIRAKATFNETYKKKYAKRTIIEIPKVYELINIAFALTSISDEENSHVVRKDIPYYKRLIEWFGPLKEHQVVTTLDSILRDQFNMYYLLKLDSYAYEFNKDTIVSKRIYDRIAQNYGENHITPDLLSQLQDFSNVSRFHQFYESQQELYDSQIDHYETKVNINRMQVWLNRNFPATSYDCFKVIFSPLVDWNQSSTWFENNGFKEAQSHVNFPYPSEFDKRRNELENELKDGEILFTELNHPFINPESENYLESVEFKEAFSNISFWIEEESAASKGYANSYSLFNELMNWSLVSLYHLDNAPIESANKLIKSTEEWQMSGRGFKRFDKFNQNLIELYSNRKKEETVADLYPEIIRWCKKYYVANNDK